MTTTIELLDAAKRATNCESDYAFGQRFGVSRQVVSSWRQKKATFNDDHAAMVAGILGREPGEVMALCAAERAKDANNRARWLRVAALLSAAVLPPAAGATTHNNSHNSQSNQDIIGIMSTVLRRFLFVDWLRLA